MTFIAQLLDTYSRIFPGVRAPRLCRAPGRVNLIGEHTDYNGLPVLPMAIDRAIHIAFSPADGHTIRLHNANPVFPAVTFENSGDIAPSPVGSWDNYCKAGIQALNRHFGVSHCPGMALLVSGDIPLAAGLSSSSAFVVASALAYLAVLDKSLDTDISRSALASLLADAEHYVGTRGGGMDQAIILLAREAEATKIDFFPLRAEQVPMPPNHTFVICNSMVKAEKSGDALHRYNEGPLTCRLIRALVEKRLQEDFGDDVRIERLGDLWLGNLCLTHAEVADVFAQTFPSETTTLPQASNVLGIGVDEIRKRWLGDLREPQHGFRLQARAQHQRTEYQRVEAARDALLAGDANELGRLMNASHESCANDYAVSCPELNLLVATARKAGAVGSRLTGAGFGGCVVSLIPTSLLDSFRARVTEEYYAPLQDRFGADVAASAILAAEASAGAGYVN